MFLTHKHYTITYSLSFIHCEPKTNLILIAMETAAEKQNPLVPHKNRTVKLPIYWHSYQNVLRARSFDLILSSRVSFLWICLCIPIKYSPYPSEICWLHICNLFPEGNKLTYREKQGLMEHISIRIISFSITKTSYVLYLLLFWVVQNCYAQLH